MKIGELSESKAAPFATSKCAFSGTRNSSYLRLSVSINLFLSSGR